METGKPKDWPSGIVWGSPKHEVDWANVRALHEAELHNRLIQYAAEYSAKAWPDLPFRHPEADDLLRMEVRADGYSNAHVEGEHSANGICSYSTSQECGERHAAEEYVESH